VQASITLKFRSLSTESTSERLSLFPGFGPAAEERGATLEVNADSFIRDWLPLILETRYTPH